MIKIQDIECLKFLKVSKDINPKNYSIMFRWQTSEIEWSEGDHTSLL